jgi:hypothetical protein
MKILVRRHARLAEGDVSVGTHHYRARGVDPEQPAELASRVAPGR